MNTEALFLFLILLLGLVLCSFLGGNCVNEGFTTESSSTFTNKSTQNNNNNNKNNNISKNRGTSGSYDNYNHFNGSYTQLSSGTTFYGENGGSIVVETDKNGQQSLKVTLANGEQPMTFSSQQDTSTTSSTTESYTNYYGNNGSATTFYGPNGATATVVETNNGQQGINVQTSSGSYTYTQSGSSYNPNNTSSTQYYGSTGTPIQSSSSSLAYQGPYGGSAGAVTGPEGNTAYYAQGPNGNTVAGTTNSTSYYDSFPTGISGNQIPPGKEDLYILKSQVVPPVCPACPVSAACPRQEKCPPCPACARCPEPAFECKKVPNYNAIGSEYLPAPVLNDFSSFGM